MEIKTGLLPYSSNYKKGRSAKIKYIVIHYTGNKGDTAFNNVKYFAKNYVKASAHFFVDENSVYTSVPADDTAWHCGGGLQGTGGHQWYGLCTNSNSIGIEMCLLDKNGKVKQGTVTRCITLVKYLMEKYQIPSQNVVRHYDVTGKNCPMPFVNDSDKWQKFKKELENFEMEEIKRINEVIFTLENEIKNLKLRIEAAEKENNRQNDIINLVGKDIQELRQG